MIRPRPLALMTASVCLVIALAACQSASAPTLTPPVTSAPSPSAEASAAPTPSLVPTEAPIPSLVPSVAPTPSLAPTEAPIPSLAPTLEASVAPSLVPTLAPAASTPSPAASAPASAAASLVPSEAPATSPEATEAPASTPAASDAPSLRPFGPPSATPNPVPLDAPAGDGTAVRLTTDLGDIVIGLFNESAPVAAENFQNLAEARFYDGVGFHRVVPGFVIQGGDPEGTGRGGPGYTIADEEVVGEYGRGIVAMARTPAPDSQGSQFFIVLDDAAKGSLDAARTYAIFGRVVEGMDVVDAIVAARPASDLIEDPVRIISTAVEQVELPPEPTPEPPSAEDLAAAALVARLPTEVAGMEMTDTDAFTSQQVLGQLTPEVLAPLSAAAETRGADLGGLIVARTGGAVGEAYASLVASTIPGLPADEAMVPMARILLGFGAEVVPTRQTIAGRTVSVFDLGNDRLAYALPSDDLVWVFITDPGSLEAVVSALP